MSTKTVQVPHLWGTIAAYHMPHPYDPSKPTLVLVNSFTTDASLYAAQYANPALTSTTNLLAIELLGHGQTRTTTDNWTYWDTAIMNLQVLDALDITGKVFVLGTSQGGWITVRMALLRPDRIAGIIPLGTSMDAENARTVELGCWDGLRLVGQSVQGFTAAEGTGEAFEPPDEFVRFLIDVGFGEEFEGEERREWEGRIKANYTGEEGRKRIRMASVNLRDRDGLHNRLGDVKCPVLWMHGTKDAVYSAKNAEDEIKLFVNSPDAKLKVVEGGRHFLSWSHPQDVDSAIIGFVSRYS
ncbi:alpha/beta-hydrolase [Aulographum hederae CBS 113979]|uniref:Alpha/beta-hydrolase n=1 Tax=Aulographum hederae CBS 113979 TaxID=1176131 RepID=A0A6G1H5D6_9PEZI|nr:alpha/beta-hydrolase [Aulographum hederae CBS 113979]